MWGAISKIFTKNSSFNNSSSEPQPPDEMDRGERKNYSHFDDSFTTKQAKQRASIKWLLSKAFNNKVPENIQEPFYRDHEDQEHLKPQIAGALANAEIYCRALANIYSDPNYHNLNHWAILQTLSRKSTYVTEPSDGCQLTETTLIQTNPLRMFAIKRSYEQQDSFKCSGCGKHLENKQKKKICSELTAGDLDTPSKRKSSSQHGPVTV